MRGSEWWGAAAAFGLPVHPAESPPAAPSAALPRAAHALAPRSRPTLSPHQLARRFTHLVGYGATYYSYLYAQCLAARIWQVCAS